LNVNYDVNMKYGGRYKCIECNGVSSDIEFVTSSNLEVWIDDNFQHSLIQIGSLVRFNGYFTSGNTSITKPKFIHIWGKYRGNFTRAKLSKSICTCLQNSITIQSELASDFKSANVIFSSTLIRNAVHWISLDAIVEDYSKLNRAIDIQVGLVCWVTDVQCRILPKNEQQDSINTVNAIADGMIVSNNTLLFIHDRLYYIISCNSLNEPVRINSRTKFILSCDDFVPEFDRELTSKDSIALRIRNRIVPELIYSSDALNQLSLMFHRFFCRNGMHLGIPCNSCSISSTIQTDHDFISSLLITGQFGTGKSEFIKYSAECFAHSVFEIHLNALLHSSSASNLSFIIKNIFHEAYSASNTGICVILIHRIELLNASTSDKTHEILMALSLEMSAVNNRQKMTSKYGCGVLVLASTWTCENIPECLTLSHCIFDKILTLSFPNYTERLIISRALIESIRISEIHQNCIQSLIEFIANRTAGFIVSDFKRILTQFNSISNSNNSTLHNIKHSVLSITPTVISSCRWWRPAYLQDSHHATTLFGLESSLNTLSVYLRASIDSNTALRLRQNGVGIPRGILIQGPSGSGKTQLCIQAASVIHGAQVLQVDSAELISSVVGESERALTQLFQFARAASPTVLIIEQIEILAPRRMDADEQGPSASGQRLLSTLLTQLDGVLHQQSEDKNRQRVLILATTENRENIDPALLRPGRIEVDIQLQYPNEDSRRKIFTHYLQVLPTVEMNEEQFHSLVNKVARLTQGCSAPQIIALCQQAATYACNSIRDELSSEKNVLITEADILLALNSIK